MKPLSIKGLSEDWLFPTTRYRGSKRKILYWIWENTKNLHFDTALDLFGGTGTVSLLFKRMGKEVTYNDYLRYAHISGRALVQNKNTRLSKDDVGFLLRKHRNIIYSDFIGTIFKDYYFLDSENKWLDIVLTNINSLNTRYDGEELDDKKAIAIWAVGQACLIKRPFNLFHRKNLNIRTRIVDRKFGNKTTWETPFDIAFNKFVEEANSIVFDNNKNNKAICCDALKFSQTNYDLVYLDPPYFFNDLKDSDYLDLYHFLEGITEIDRWPNFIDYNSVNLRYKKNGNQWIGKTQKDIGSLYEILLRRFGNSKLIISHKSGSIFPVNSIKSILESLGKTVITNQIKYTYALNKANHNTNSSTEWLILGI